MSRDHRARIAQIGESEVALAVAKMNYVWHYRGDRHFGIDAIIEIRRHSKNTGLFLPLQVKTGKGHLARETKTHYVIKVKRKHLEYWVSTPAPTILVWYNIEKRKAFWTKIERDSPPKFKTRVEIPKASKFGTHCAGSLFQLARRSYGYERILPAVSAPPELKPAFSAVKTSAREFYLSWRSEGCVSPTFGPVMITLRGWKHLTADGNTQCKMVRKLELLGAAKRILETVPEYHVCRQTPHRRRDMSLTRYFHQQTAVVSYAHRADAIVSVITEQFGGGPVRFYSVFEHEVRRPRREVHDGSLGATAVWPLPGFYKPRSKKKAVRPLSHNER